MAYLLEFPTKPLPGKAHSPPYVLFAINGQNIAEQLPSNIPLNLVSHFAPKLKQWLLPPPSTSQLPWATAKLALRTPAVGINIHSDQVDAKGMIYIISKMLLVSGLAYQRSLFFLPPSILDAISIHRTWLALDLPLAGVQALHTRIETRFLHCPPVAFAEMVAIWEAFPHTSRIVRTMGVNFIQSFVSVAYNPLEFTTARKWYLSSQESRSYFLALENEFPAFGELLANIQKGRQEREASANKSKETLDSNVSSESTNGQNKQKVLKLKNVHCESVRPREPYAGATKLPRLRRSKSGKSTPAEETATGVESHTSSDEESHGDDSSEGYTSTKRSEPLPALRRNIRLSKPLDVGEVFKRLLDLGDK